MSTFATDGQESTALDRPRHVPLGTDAAGYDHHHAAADEKIYVVDGATIAHVEDLSYHDGRDWQDWLGYVEKVRGWTDTTVAAFVATAFGGQ